MAWWCIHVAPAPFQSQSINGAPGSPAHRGTFIVFVPLAELNGTLFDLGLSLDDLLGKLQQLLRAALALSQFVNQLEPAFLEEVKALLHPLKRLFENRVLLLGYLVLESIVFDCNLLLGDFFLELGAHPAMDLLFLLLH